jgi:hypothetical protein
MLLLWILRRGAFLSRVLWYPSSEYSQLCSARQAIVRIFRIVPAHLEIYRMTTLIKLATTKELAHWLKEDILKK